MSEELSGQVRPYADGLAFANTVIDGLSDHFANSDTDLIRHAIAYGYSTGYFHASTGRRFDTSPDAEPLSVRIADSLRVQRYTDERANSNAGWPSRGGRTLADALVRGNADANGNDITSTDLRPQGA